MLNVHPIIVCDCYKSCLSTIDCTGIAFPTGEKAPLTSVLTTGKHSIPTQHVHNEKILNVNMTNVSYSQQNGHILQHL